VKPNATIDRTMQESMRVLVRRVLRRYGCPPDKQEQAVTTVLQQAEPFAETWAA
jgi:type I restriction enzyme R subunit